MDWAAIWRDIGIGLLVAGALAAWVPDSWWQSLFLVDHPTAAKFWGPVVGPLVAVLSFVCSVGNIPLAAVLWNGGISFGGVIAFIFGDLIIAPILNIYRKYYGWRMAAFLARAVLYGTMVVAGLGVELLFERSASTPTERDAKVIDGERHLELHDVPQHRLPRLAAVLVWRYFRRGGGIAMLRMMNEPAARRARARANQGRCAGRPQAPGASRAGIAEQEQAAVPRGPRVDPTGPLSIKRMSSRDWIRVVQRFFAVQASA